jgi:hypothetical protein
MSKPVEFKEKTYEKYFGHELVRMVHYFWYRNALHSFSPDITDEKDLGFDEAFLVPEIILEKILKCQRPIGSGRLIGMSIPIINEEVRRLSGYIKEYKFNLFVQYKRPVYITRAHGKEWDSWGGPYFRFKINSDQQDALLNMEKISNKRAEVVYASAAFSKYEKMFDFVLNNKIILNSNICNVSRLIDHSTYTYASAGGHGIAHSEPVPVESDTLEAIIERGMLQYGVPYNQHIKRTAKDINQLIATGSREAKLIDRARRVMLRYWSPIDAEWQDDSFVHAMATIMAFCEILDVSFYPMG